VAGGAPVRRLALYELPGPQTVPREWRDRMSAMLTAGRPGPAMLSFLTEVMGLTGDHVSELRNAPRDYDVLPIASATMPREAQALADGEGHNAIDAAPAALAGRLAAFFS
jgi:hypothetical protein